MKPTNTNTQQVERDIEAGNKASQDSAKEASAEQAADLAALQAAASPTDQVSHDQQPEQTGPSEAAMQVAALAVGILRPVVAYAVPSLRNAPSELWEPIPAGVAGILDHYNIGIEALQNPWARLALACAPLAAFAAVEAMKEKPKEEPDVKEALAIEVAKQIPITQPAGQKTVTFGNGGAALAPVAGTA